MKNYYSILGVPSSAGADTIKRAYRKLAILYHPDKNPSPDVEQFFKEINEAYDVVGDPQKRSEYDDRLLNPVYQAPGTAQHPVHRDPRYRPTTNYKARGSSEQQRINELIVQYALYAKRISNIAFCIGMLLIIDFLLPRVKEWEGYKSHEYVRVGRHKSQGGSIRVFTLSGSSFKISSEDSRLVENADSLLLHRSVVAGKITQAESNTNYTAQASLNIYGHFIFMPIVLLLVSSLGTFVKGKPEFVFNTGVMSGLLLLLTTMFFFFFN